MKTKIIGFTLGLALIISPVLVHADTVQEQYVSALHQIIALLQQQVELLLAQLNVLQVTPPTSPVPPTVITPVVVPPPPVFGNTPPPAPTPTPQVPADLSRMDITTGINYVGGDNKDRSFSRNDTIFTKGKDVSFSIGVIVFDKNGKQVKLPVIVTTDDPDIPFSFNINGQGVGGSFAVGQFENEYKLQHGECALSTDCTPISKGTFTFTFNQSDLNLTKSITIEVK